MCPWSTVTTAWLHSTWTIFAAMWMLGNGL